MMRTHLYDLRLLKGGGTASAEYGNGQPVQKTHKSRDRHESAD